MGPEAPAPDANCAIVEKCKLCNLQILQVAQFTCEPLSRSGVRLEGGEGEGPAQRRGLRGSGMYEVLSTFLYMVLNTDFVDSTLCRGRSAGAVTGLNLLVLEDA